MIVDASALLAILLEESEATDFTRAIGRSDVARMSAVNWFEASVIVDRQDSAIARRRFDELIDMLNIDIVAFTPAQAEIARRAWRRFGGGRHSARLNFGDCMAYALAIAEGQPLLFKGNDFTQTDVTPALSS